jgi:hypothetical protein
MGHKHQLAGRSLSQPLGHREKTTGERNRFKRGLIACAVSIAQYCRNAFAKLNAGRALLRVLGE